LIAFSAAGDIVPVIVGYDGRTSVMRYVSVVAYIAFDKTIEDTIRASLV
jgi:hypothetical protein